MQDARTFEGMLLDIAPNSNWTLSLSVRGTRLRAKRKTRSAAWRTDGTAVGLLSLREGMRPVVVAGASVGFWGPNLLGRISQSGRGCVKTQNQIPRFRFW
jgi:hypothetical protein